MSAFRPDIEGLRALAVLLVLAFHHGWGGVSGGFIGVDVFFVISGYLITRNIREQAEAGRFSFRQFYVRRMRRLFPALFATVALSVVAGMVISSPVGLAHLAESAVATVFSVSNIYFWKQSGYFDAAASAKPLLHSWSLAVEEQFYLVWPVMVVLMVRYARWALAFLLAMGLASFAAAEFFPGKQMAAAFYLTPYRMGEFALGALCTWLPAGGMARWVRELVTVAGLGLVLYPAFVFSEVTAFPGFSAVVPCVGAALLIAAHGGWLSRLLLGNPVMVMVGRVSYSLYLVHWPVYVFFRQYQGRPPEGWEPMMLSAVSLVMAGVMYRWVEQPFRFPHSKVATRSFLKLCGGVTVCLMVVSVAVVMGKGWGWRFPAEVVRFSEEAEAEKQARFDPYRQRCVGKDVKPCDRPVAGKVNVFVFGDSHAPDAFNALVEQFPDYHYVFSSMGGCPPLVREDDGLLTARHPNRDACKARNEAFLYGEDLAQAGVVVINTVFMWYRPEHLERAIAQIRTKTEAPILVFGNYLIFQDDFPEMVLWHGALAMDGYYEARLAKHSFAYDIELEELSRRLGVTYISKRKLLCKGEGIEGCPILFDGRLFTYDQHHFSRAAARQLGLEVKAKYGHIVTGLTSRK